MLAQGTFLLLFLSSENFFRVHSEAIKETISKKHAVGPNLNFNNFTKYTDITEMCFLCNSNGGHTVRDAIEHKNLTTFHKRK